LKDILEERAFSDNDDDGCNNWSNSSLRERLNGTFYNELGLELEEHTSDLTSDDGMTDYGTSKDYVFLLTADDYRKYRKFIPDAYDWWWLITPWTCNSSYSYTVRIVLTDGTLSNYYAHGGGIGVRPACVFSQFVICDDDDSNSTGKENIVAKLDRVQALLDEIKNDFAGTEESDE
jgi:hypothetical protein